METRGGSRSGSRGRSGESFRGRSTRDSADPQNNRILGPVPLTSQGVCLFAAFQSLCRVSGFRCQYFLQDPQEGCSIVRIFLPHQIRTIKRTNNLNSCVHMLRNALKPPEWATNPNSSSPTGRQGQIQGTSFDLCKPRLPPKA